ncbi:uncharacterized protein O9250_010444 isoform 4-T4 [Rhynochetos jubatus]
MRSEDTGGSSQVSRVTDGKGGEKEKEVSEPAKSPGSAQRESCSWFPLPLDRFPLSPVAISSCRGAARAGREGTIGEVKVSCRQRGL